MKNATSQRRSRRGTSTVELAIGAPLLLLISVAAADFSRVFFNSITITNASGAASLVGSFSVTDATNVRRLEAVALSDASDLDGLSADADLYCDCPDGGGPVDCISGMCTGYGPPRVFSKVRVQQSFELIAPWPGIPNPMQVSRQSYVRVQ